jgi:hypothetical protein
VPNAAPVLQPPVLAYAALQPNVPVLQMMDGQCYQLVVREWYGQPFVFPLPVLPTYVHAPFAPTGGVLGVPTHAGAATPAAAAAGTPAGGGAAAGAAAQAQDGGALPAGAGMGAGMAAAGGGGDFFDEGEEANTDSLKLLLKLALFVYILGQDGGLQRVLVLTAAAVAIFLAQTGRLDFVQRRLGGAARALDAGDAEPRAAAEGAGDEGARNEDGGQPRPEAGAQVRRCPSRIVRVGGHLGPPPRPPRPPAGRRAS